MNASTQPDNSMSSAASDQALIVFYDGACPICRREIAFLRSLRRADSIAWKDVSSEQARLPESCTRNQLLERFHVQRPNGRVLSGAQAFAEVWSALPSMRWLGRVARHPVLLPALERAYRVFLRIRPALQRLLA